MKNAFVIGMILLYAFLLYALARTGSASKQRLAANAALLDTTACAIEKWDIKESALRNIRYANRPFFISDSARTLLRSYAGDSAKLFFRVQFPSCETCISQLVRGLKSNTELLGQDNIILLTEFRNEKEIAGFVRKYDLGKFRLHNIPELELCLDLQDFIGSYLFTLSDDFRAENLFIGSKHNAYMLDDYFASLGPR